MVLDSEREDRTVIEVRNEHADEIAKRLSEMGGTFRQYGKPNTVFRPSEGSPPVPYYSPRRPTRRLRLLCWLIGARLDYLPDRNAEPERAMYGDEIRRHKQREDDKKDLTK